MADIDVASLKEWWERICQAQNPLAELHRFANAVAAEALRGCADSMAEGNLVGGVGAAVVFLKKSASEIDGVVEDDDDEEGLA